MSFNCNRDVKKVILVNIMIKFDGWFFASYALLTIFNQYDST